MAEAEKPNEFESGEGVPTAGYGGAAIGPGAVIGRYKLLRILGEGGVWDCLPRRAAAAGEAAGGAEGY